MGMDLPFFFDSSLTATPFLIFGHIIMSRTYFFKKDYNRVIYLSLSLVMIGTALFTASGDIDYRINNFKTSLFHIYFPAFMYNFVKWKDSRFLGQKNSVS